MANDLPQFSTLLQQAITEPGKLHAAYSYFHDYSVGNSMLAMMECYAREIDLGPINTYKGWQSLGRQVRKGSKAISLIMPVTCKGEHKDAETGELQEFQFARFIMRANWFVLSQTDGEDVTLPALPEWDTDTALNALQITRVPFESVNGNSQGYAMPGRRVAVSPVAALPHKTILHEIAHVLLGHLESGVLSDDERTPKNLREVEAESVAYLCIASLGLDGMEYSRGYIQHWLHASEIPEKSAQKIFTTATAILKAGRPSPANAL